MNNKPFQVLEGCRRSMFEDLEKPFLKPLPAQRYEFARWKSAKVNIDYHVEAEKNFYSVPYQLVKEQVDVRLTAGAVEILHKGKRVASHERLRGKGRFTTLPEHMPKAHQKHLQWTPSRILRWASESGLQTEALVQAIMDSKPHPEQGYRACIGLIRLGERYTVKRLEAACARALIFNTLSYSSVNSILKKGLDQLPRVETLTAAPICHQNVRGSEYYLTEGQSLC